MKTLDKEGVQYTLQRMVTLLAAIQEKLNAPYPEYKEGTFIPKFWNDSDVEQTFDSVNGYYKRIGNLCYIFISAQTSSEQTSSDVSVTFINNLPFVPNTNIYGTHPGKEGLVFANGAACFVGVPYSPGQIILAEPATGNLLVEGIYNI